MLKRLKPKEVAKVFVNNSKIKKKGAFNMGQSARKGEMLSMNAMLFSTNLRRWPEVEHVQVKD